MASTWGGGRGRGGRGQGIEFGRGRGGRGGNSFNEGVNRGGYKRPVDNYDPLDIKRSKTSSVEEMSKMIEDSQREIANLKTSNVGADHVNQVLEKQQKLLEMQSKMLAGLGGVPAVQDVEPFSQSSFNNGRGSDTSNRGGFATGRGLGGETRGRGGDSGRGSFNRGRGGDIGYGGDAGQGSFTKGRGYDVGYGGDVGRSSFTRGRIGDVGRGSFTRGRGGDVGYGGDVGRDSFTSGLGGDIGHDSFSRGRGGDVGLDSFSKGRGGGAGYNSFTRGRGADTEQGRDTRGRGSDSRSRGRGRGYGSPVDDPYYSLENLDYGSSSYPSDPVRGRVSDFGSYAKDPYTDVPYAADPYANDLYAKDPYAPDPYAPDPYAPDPYAADTYRRAEDPYRGRELPPARGEYEMYGKDPYGEDRYDVPYEDPYARVPTRDPLGYEAEESHLARSAGTRGRGRGYPPTRGKPGGAYAGRGAYPVEDATEYSVSVEGKLNTFSKLLFDYKDIYSPVSAIETTRHDNTEVVKIRTIYETTEDVSKDLYIGGYLKINGVLLASERGLTNHHVKDKVYSKAVYMLLSKTVSEIFAAGNILAVALNKEASEQGRKHRTHRFVHYRLRALVNVLREELMESSRFASTENNLVHQFDLASGNADAGVTLVYLQNDATNTVICELYADDLMLGSGEAKDKKTAYQFAYRNARRLMLHFGITPDEIISENKRLQDLDYFSPSVIDVQFKAKNYERGTNLFALKKSYPDTVVEDVSGKRDVVLYEYGRAYNSDSYKLLEAVALANRMQLEYTMYSRDEEAVYRTFIFLHEKVVGEGFGYNKLESKLIAADKAYTYLKQNCTIVQIEDRNYKNLSIDFNRAKVKARQLKNEQPDLESTFEPSNYIARGATDPEPDELSPWIDHILEGMIINFSRSTGFEELIFGNDFPNYHVICLKERCKNYAVTLTIKRGGNNQFKNGCIIIQKDFLKNADPQTLVEKLKILGCRSGRYSLLQYKDENDIIVQC
ncbi:uncharacterized protein LOC126821397 [Patella vulgata]|uniref:uncharacterized protein LOC126821397 n=1 Tax=Patella vulgata TaxID=6465 RepID=UPI0021802EC9|nr:uncharacterized protein LOC126821397 [Patella vulgata]XP_050405780.1 uncharacterized protein LOC126821397 [Patella vulgata]